MPSDIIRADLSHALAAVDSRRHNAQSVPRFNPAGPFWVDPDVLDWTHAHYIHFRDRARALEAENRRLRARVAYLEAADDA